VLTPHLCSPAEGEYFPDDIGIMRAGVYNLGFLGVRGCDESEDILAWWSRRLEYQCINDVSSGLFVDQKFMDLVPGFAENAFILRDPTVNVAYWNLPQRRLSREDTIWTVDDRELGFYHFSGFNPKKLNQLSKHTLAFRGDAISPALAGLMEQYAEQLRANRHGTIPAGLYAYGRFASGRPIPSIVRRMFRERQVVWPDNPFKTYENYLHAPAPGQWTGSSSAIVTNLMAYLHSQHSSLQHHFDLSHPAGVNGYVEWYLRNGESYVEFAKLIEPVAERVGRRSAGPVRHPPALRSREEADVNVIGYLKAAMGVGEAGRLSLRTLCQAGLRARGVDTSLNSKSKSIDRSCDHLLGPEANGRFQLFNVNLDQLPQVMDELQSILRPDAYRIAIPFWELAHLPDEWLAASAHVDEIWAPSRFIQMMLVKKINKPVIYMPLALDFERPEGRDRRHFRLPEGCFLFFFAFDYLSFLERKNPMAVIRAFKRAFRNMDRHRRVKLVLKTMNSDEVHDEGKSMRDMIQEDTDIILIDDVLSRQDTLSLIMACDAVVTLHRSEGFGLLVAEAMVLGKPVISTDYSATTELVTPDTGWPVDYQLIAVKPGEYPFHEGQVWADVDLDHAAWQMNQVVANPDAVRRKTAAAHAFIAKEHAMNIVGQQQVARLKKIEGNFR
jgi:glycosyltransferase involved in cell wall biosynthesis